MRRIMPFMAILAVFAFYMAGFAGGFRIAAAQDVTPEVTAQPTAEVTPVVVVTPVPVPAPAPFDVNVVLPYVGGALVVAILGIIGVAGTGLLLLFRSTPAAQFLSKTVLPPLGDAGVKAFEDYSKLTPQTFDDDLAKQLRSEWEAFKQQMTSDVMNLTTSPTLAASVASKDEVDDLKRQINFLSQRLTDLPKG